MTLSIRTRIFAVDALVSSVCLGGAATLAQTTTTCTGLPGTYVKLENQPYALCAGATSVNFGEVTYAKCKKMNGTSISAEQKYPWPSVNAFNAIKNSGNIANVNARQPARGGYVVSTYSPPSDAIGRGSAIALYTCTNGGSYAQCDGGICFESTTGKSSPIWGKVSDTEIVCSCPVASTKAPFQVFGPGDCPTTQAAYDAVCAANASSINNGAILYIGAPATTPEAMAKCLDPSFKKYRHCARPSN